MTDTATLPNLRFGLLGCARITRRALIGGLRDSRHAEALAIASRDLATARAWAEEFGIPKVHSYETVLKDPDIDAVYVPLPNELHRLWVLAAADSGKHVLCEKPLALNADEAREMVEHCQRLGVVLMEAFMWRHQPRTAELLRLVAEGTIGDLRLIRCSFSFPIAPEDWRLDPNRGGGALWDVGCYGVSTCRLFASSEPTDIATQGHLGPSGVDLSLSALLRFPGDRLGIVDCSFEQPFRCEYELVGTLGRILVPDAYLPPDQPFAQLNRIDEPPRTLNFEGRDQYAAMLDAFARSVAAGRLLPPSENGLAQMVVLDSISNQFK